MVSLGSLFGEGSIGEQLFVWGLLNQIVGALTAPGINELSYLVNEATTNAPLPPAQAAAALARGMLDTDTAHSEAAKAGFSGTTVDRMAALAASPPDLGLLIGALQRGVIGVGSGDPGEVSLSGALRHAGVPANWLPVIEKMAVQIPSVAEVMNAWLEGQISESEAHTRYLAAGGDPTWFQTSYNANGQAPTPVEALDMLNRGLIPLEGTGPDSTSYHQAFLEGPWRNKWLPAFEGLRNYIPPPRTTTAMYREGSITLAMAESFLKAHGVTPDLYPAYLHTKDATPTSKDKELTRADVLTAYEAKLITPAQAIADLAEIGYHGDVATTILALADLKATRSAATSAVNRIKALYTGRKLTRTAAAAALAKVVTKGTNVTQLMDYWDVEVAATVRQLTPAQIEGAFDYGVFTQAEATAELVTLGYTPFDAWVLLSVKNKGPLPNKPAQGPASVGVLP